MKGSCRTEWYSRRLAGPPSKFVPPAFERAFYSRARDGRSLLSRPCAVFSPISFFVAWPIQSAVARALIVLRSHVRLAIPDGPTQSTRRGIEG